MPKVIDNKELNFVEVKLEAPLAEAAGPTPIDVEKLLRNLGINEL